MKQFFAHLEISSYMWDTESEREEEWRFWRVTETRSVKVRHPTEGYFPAVCQVERCSESEASGCWLVLLLHNTLSFSQNIWTLWYLETRCNNTTSSRGFSKNIISLFKLKAFKRCDKKIWTEVKQDQLSLIVKSISFTHKSVSRCLEAQLHMWKVYKSLSVSRGSVWLLVKVFKWNWKFKIKHFCFFGVRKKWVYQTTEGAPQSCSRGNFRIQRNVSTPLCQSEE